MFVCLSRGRYKEEDRVWIMLLRMSLLVTIMTGTEVVVLFIWWDMGMDLDMERKAKDRDTLDRLRGLNGRINEWEG